MKTINKLIATSVCAFLVTFLVNSQPSMDYSLLIEDIEFQPGVTIDININVYVNENAANWSNHGKIFAIEGMAHTANCWKPLAEELFVSAPPSAHINEFYAIDMPGRGGSGFPQGWNDVSNDVFKLADMYFEDYLAVIRGALEYLIDVHGVKPNTIMGHSLGGLEVILLQDMLVQQGSNLKKAYGIKNAILLAPAIPAPLPWAFLGTGAGQLIPMAVEDPNHGWILNIPFTTWPWLFFTNTCCYFPPGNPYGYPPSLVPGAPDAATVLANGYNSIEAGPLLFHMGGLPISILDPDSHHPTRPRISVNQNIFTRSKGTRLVILADEFDKMMTPDEELALYQYLSADFMGHWFHVALGDETCHDTHISDPHAIVALLDKPYYFKNAEVEEEDVIQIQTDLEIYPNPAGGMATISYVLSSDAFVELKLFNINGEEVSALMNEWLTTGEGHITFSTQNLKSGVYFVRMNAGQTQLTGKILIR